MNVGFSPQAWKEFLYWSEEGGPIFDRLLGLIEECRRTPFEGRGKPEPLRRELAGWWSRRLNAEHRLIYRVHGKGDDQWLEIAQCRFHY